MFVRCTNKKMYIYSTGVKMCLIQIEMNEEWIYFQSKPDYIALFLLHSYKN